MFINISNHPSSKWGKEQIEKARELGNGEVIDIPFPNIDPRWDKRKIYDVVSKIGKEVFSKTQKEERCIHYIHVMGESGFVWCFITFIKDVCPNVICVHSTTERVVEEKDGQKTSVFRFIQFREY